MYSMKRRMWPLPLKWRAIGRMSRSLTPRLTTMLTLIGESPAAAAASMPSSTLATGKSTSFIARNDSVVERVEAHRDAIQPGFAQRLCLVRPAAAPLVVSVRSRPPMSASIADQSLEVPAQQRLAAGQPDFFDAVTLEHPREPRDFLEASADPACGRNG